MLYKPLSYSYNVNVPMASAATAFTNVIQSRTNFTAYVGVDKYIFDLTN